MTKAGIDKIAGGVTVAILFGIPLAVFLGPIALSVFLVSLLIGIIKKKNVAPKRTEEQMRADELITTILPTVDPKS